jgi:hypothetical protein
MSLRATQEELKSFNVVAEGKPLPLKKKLNYYYYYYYYYLL